MPTPTSHRNALALIALCVARASTQAQTQLTVASPDARTQVRVEIRDGHLTYSVTRDRRALVLPSLLGFEFRGAPPLRDSLRVTGTSSRSYDTTWTQPWGEVARVREQYNEVRVSVAESSTPGRKFDVVFRAFNDGIGFRYEVPAQAALGDFQIQEELTEFSLADDAKSWWIPSNRPRLDRSEMLYSSSPVSVIDSDEE